MRARLAEAEAVARQGRLVTFGIVPDRPETGYGYIRTGEPLGDGPAHAVAAFVEKPDAATAEGYLAAGNYLWNSGMFVARAADLLDEMRRFCPEVVSAAEAALAGATRDLDFLRLDAGAFGQAPSISLDYAVMERTDRAAVIPADVGWHDLGAWPSLWSVADKDEDGNVAVGEAFLTDTTGSYLHAADGRLIAAIGLTDTIVVSTDDALLVAPRARAPEIGALAKTLAERGRSEAIDPRVIHRPWGSYETLAEADGFKVKRIVVQPGGRLSLQYHERRSEHWVVVSGEAWVTVGEDSFALGVDTSTYVPKGKRHQLENRTAEPLVMIEVQFGDYVGEDDIVRLSDIYGRQAAKAER
jgi:mannose-1-phosphate guanylyltransferase/mannose-6-phosphate isomerase